MPVLLPTTPDAAEIDRRRYPAIFAEASSSAQSDVERDQVYLRELVKTAYLSSYHRLEQVYIELLDELAILRALDRGWDTYDALPPSEATIQAVQRTLGRLKIFGALPVAVRPSSDGGIGICFQRADAYGQLEFLNDGDAYALTYSAARPAQSWRVDRTDAGLRRAWDQIRAYLQP